MKLSLTFFFFASLLLSINVTAQSQTTVIDSVSNVFKTFMHNSSKENIMLQTDRKLYIAGEQVWLRAWVVNAADNKVDLSSKNLYTDLTDDNDSVIAKLVLNNRQLNSTGAFNLPDSIKTGFYWLRCYTDKILSEDPENIFVQPLYILNKRLKDENNYNRQYANMLSKSKNALPVIHFFPERLTGVPSVISTGVLQIADLYNNPVEAKGTLVNNKDSVVATFTTNHFGMARITFLDDADQKYTAVFHINDRDVKYNLPPIDHTAVQLSVTNQTTKNIKAFVTLEDSVSPGFRSIILGVHGDSLCYAAVGTGTYGINIPLNNFPGGIASLLLFNEQQQLVTERKIYIDKDNYQLDVKANKKNYAARENATISIKAKDASKEPLEATLNISIQDAWLTQLSDSIEINSLPPSNELLLNNWLTFYHDKYSPADIDLLMTTLKSLHITSANFDATTVQPVNDDDEKLLNLVGKITGKKDTPMQDRVITVMAKNESGFFTDVDTTNTDGTFKIPLPQNMDSLMLSVQVMDKHGVIRTDDNIVIDSFNFPQFATPPSLKQQFLAANINTLALARKYHIDTAITFQGKGWLKPVTVKTVVRAEPNYDVTRRISNISQILTSDKFRYGGYGAVGNALLMVPGISYSNGKISIFGTGVHPNGTVGAPLLVVDGIVTGYVNILDYFNELPAADIDFIEVLRGGEAGIYGMRGGDGVISINTKHGPDKIDYSKTNFKVLVPVTYHVSPKFVMPDYSKQEIKNNVLPDPRTTIYWNGNLFTDSTGQTTVNFYTADNRTNYTITVTGLSAKGDIINKRILISRN